MTARPIGVTLVAIVAWVSGFGQIIGSVFGILGGLLVTWTALVAWFGLIVGAVTLAVGVALWRGNPTARTIAMIVFSITVAGGVISLLGGESLWSALSGAAMSIIGLILLNTRPPAVISTPDPADRKDAMRPTRTVALALTALLAAAAATGCTAKQPVDINEVEGIPARWLEVTADGWPDSDGYNANMPVLSRGKCLLTDEPPTILGETPEFTNAGWGGYGDSKDGYRYLCRLWAPDVYSGELQLIQADTPATARLTVSAFLETPSTAVQDNTVETLQVGTLDVHVMSRWYPTNPHGTYLALYLDEDANALVQLEVNSLDEADYEELGPRAVAEALVRTLGSD